MAFDFNQYMQNPLTQLGLSMLSQWKTPGGQSGGSLAGALQTFQGMQQANQQRAMQQLQMDQLKRQQEQQTREDALRAQVPELLKKYQRPAVPGVPETVTQSPIADLIGMHDPYGFTPPPTVTPAQPAQPAGFDAQGFQQEMLPIQAQLDPMGTMQSLMKQYEPKAPIKVGAEDVLLDPLTMKPVYKGPGKEQYKERTNVKNIQGVPHYIKEFSQDNGKNWQPLSDPYPVKSTVANISATATAGNKEAAKSLAGPIGERAETSLSLAEGATETMTNANMVREALNKGEVIAGPLAGVRMKWAQLKDLAGAGNAAELQQTRTTIQGLASLTLDSRASLKGQGQITEGETKLLERARSGNIDEMTVGELQTVVDISQRLADRQWKKHQNLLGIMQKDPNAAASYQYYVPSAPLPAPVGKGKKGVPKAKTSGFADQEKERRYQEWKVRQGR